MRVLYLWRNHHRRTRPEQVGGSILTGESADGARPGRLDSGCGHADEMRAV